MLYYFIVSSDSSAEHNDCDNKPYPNLLMAVHQSNLNHFQYYFTTRNIIKFPVKPLNTSQQTTSMLLHYFGEVKVQILANYSVFQ